MRLGVDLSISEDGTVRVKKIKVGDRWTAVQQGRQWQDGNGRHVLVMLPNQDVWEIALRPDSLIWERVPGRSDLKYA